jgi:hypothetical protein
MFVYRPPKGSCWGHSIGKDPAKAKAKLDALFDAYFKRVDSVSPTTSVVAWKESVLPKVEWADAFLGPEMEKVRQFLVGVSGDRVMFVMGIVFPLSTIDPASFEFLRRFSSDAPFKMSAKNFMVGITAKNGKFAWRKPDADMAAKLEQFIG